MLAFQRFHSTTDRLTLGFKLYVDRNSRDGFRPECLLTLNPTSERLRRPPRTLSANPPVRLSTNAERFRDVPLVHRNQLRREVARGLIRKRRTKRSGQGAKCR